jgi:hypothetical protein
VTKPNYNPQSGSSLFCHVCFPITVGAGIYSLWRSKQLPVFTWYGWLGLHAPLLALRANLAGVRHFVPAAPAPAIASYLPARLSFWRF